MRVESFQLLVYVGADVKLCNKSGETIVTGGAKWDEKERNGVE
jgi:hypothetical protein